MRKGKETKQKLGEEKRGRGHEREEREAKTETQGDENREECKEMQRACK